MHVYVCAKVHMRGVSVYAEVYVQGLIYVCIEHAYMQGACVYIEVCACIGECV